MKDEDFLWWSKFRESKRGTVDHNEYMKICEIHADVYNHELEYVTKCASCGVVQLYVDEIEQKFKELCQIKN